MAGRRQQAFEAQLKDGAFLKATTKPIVDGTVTFKPPVPYAIREVKRGMDKGIHFKDNTYGLGARRCTRYGVERVRQLGSVGFAACWERRRAQCGSPPVCQMLDVELIRLGVLHCRGAQ